MAKRDKGLGMGLDALLGGSEPASQAPTAPAPAAAASGPAHLPVDAIQAGAYQPRNAFDADALNSLAQSVREHGVLQPIVVRELTGAGGGPKRYEIIAGERRFRAASIAGLNEIPVIIRSVDNAQALAIALIENIQREDLNPLEEAGAIKRLIDEFSYSHEAAAQAIGRSRSATTNLLRLLSLSVPVQQMLINNELDMGHARALLALSRADQIMLAHRVKERDLSVRETEQEVTAHLSNLTNDEGASQPRMPTRAANSPLDRDALRLQNNLSDILAAPVSIKSNNKGRGRMIIEFSSTEQFEGLLEQLGLRKKLDH